MLKIWTGGAAAVVLLAVSYAHAQDAEQWRVEDRGNGHWYQLHPSVGLDWFGWRDYAEGLGGHLVTVTTQSEQDFLFAECWPLLAPEEQVFAGGFQPPGSPEPDGDWQWVTAETWVEVLPMLPSDSPNCGAEGEDALSLGRRNVPPTLEWNDFGHCRTDVRAIIEWSADCNGDGIVDYGQILDGTYADNDGNGVPDCCEAACPGDLNGDDSVGPPDLGILLAVWGTDGGKISGADINEDGTVNAADLGLLVGAWGDCGGCG